MDIYVKAWGILPSTQLMTAFQTISREVAELEKIDSIYIGESGFEFVFDQTPLDSYDINITCKHFENHIDHSIFMNSDAYRKYKIIASKIKIQPDLLKQLPIFDKKTIGVHVRLTDMYATHKQYGYATTQTYVDWIKRYVNTDVDGIFVASDNTESLDILKQHFPNIIYNELYNRANTEITTTKQTDYWVSQLKEKKFWEASFIDMLSLSRCDELFYRPSNLNNFSVIFSDTITKTYKVG